MKIQIVSDVHLEFKYEIDWSKYLIPAGDVLIVAGDICYLQNYFTNKQTQDFFTYLKQNWEEIILVPGNHDYYLMKYNDGFYGPNWEDPVEEIELAENVFKNINWQDNNMRLVNNDVITIEDVNFVCSTLWSAIPPQHENTVRTFLADFKYIGGMTPANFNYLNQQAIKFVRNKCKELDNVVVVSHHLPTWAAVSPQYKNDDCTYGFANAYIDNMIDPKNMTTWIHGHSHDHFDKDINGVRIIRNPFGYMHEQNNGYIKDKVIEI